MLHFGVLFGVSSPFSSTLAPLVRHPHPMPEGADRVMIGVRVRADHPHRDVVEGRLLDATAAEDPGRVAVEQEAQEHGRRILLAAGAPLVDPNLTQVQCLDRIEDEVGQMIARNPIPEVGREKDGGVVVDDDEAGTHTDPAGLCFRLSCSKNLHLIRSTYRPTPDGLHLAACRENPEAYPADKPSEVPWMSEWLKSDRLLASRRLGCRPGC